MLQTNFFNYVHFDATNKEHRKMFAAFRASGKWPSKDRFLLEKEYNNVPHMINQKLLDYYIKNDKNIKMEI